METRLLQVASSFTSTPIAHRLRPLVVNAGIADDLGFTQYAQMAEYMLQPASDTEHILGTVVLVRVEDWLRDEPPPSAGTAGDGWVREKLRTRVGEFVSELTILAYRGKPVWFLACPSAGWIAGQGKLASLCRTYTNLLVARVSNVPQVTALNWPAVLSGGGFDDRHGDELNKIPFTQDAFDRLGEFVVGEVARTLAQGDLSASHMAAGGSPELAAYLAGLRVQVDLAPADSVGRAHVDRIIRTAASFSLTGEKPDIPDLEVAALLESESCILVSVSDRLGDHGPSGVVVCRESERELVVEWMSLSCTVLGKQVEYAVLSALAQVAAERHCSKLIFEFRPSGRNQPMLSFLQSVTDRELDTRYVLPLDLADARISARAVNPGAWSVSKRGLEKTARGGD